MRHIVRETNGNTGAVVPSLTSGNSAELWIGAVSTHGARQTLFIEGDPADHVYKVIRGTICLYTLMADGRRQVSRFCHAGDIFGLTAMETYPNTADTLTVASVMCIRRNQLDNEIHSNAAARADLLDVMQDELKSMQKHLLLLGRKTAVERVASFLVSMTEHAMREGKDGQTIELPMTRMDIADYLGITQETVCRVLGQLKKKGVIQVPDSHRIGVLQPDLLEDAGEDESTLTYAA